MKTLKLFGLTLMAILLSVNFTSCSKDDEENSKLQGYWYNGWYEEMYLGNKGKGHVISEDIVEGRVKRDIKWSATDISIVIDRQDWGVKSTYIYQLSDDVLILTDMDDGSTSSFSRNK